MIVLYGALWDTFIVLLNFNLKIHFLVLENFYCRHAGLVVTILSFNKHYTVWYNWYNSRPLSIYLTTQHPQVQLNGRRKSQPP